MPNERVIHHYPVTEALSRVHVPAGAKIISAAVRDRGRGLAVYIEHWGGEKTVPMDIVFVGTGHPFQHFDLDHVATLVDGPFVWHVYGKIHHG